MFCRVGADPILELVHVGGVCGVEVRSGNEGRAVELALGNVLDPGGQVVVVATVGRALRLIGEHFSRQLEFVSRDTVNRFKAGPENTVKC